MNIQPLDQVKSIIANALNQAANVRKSYQTFLVETIVLILTIYGKLSFLQLARHGKSCESRFHQNFKKGFDWCRFNINFCPKDPNIISAIALDHCFLSKSGSKTPGANWYWSGCAGAVQWGLEILGFAYIRSGIDDARFLYAVQTLPVTKRGRIPFYLKHMKGDQDNQTAKCLRAIFSKREELLSLSNILVGDGLFASFNFVTGAKALGFHVVSRLRDDAVLQYLYEGPQKKRGRRRELDGQVDINNLRSEVFKEHKCTLQGEEYKFFTAITKCKSLKQKIRVVIAEYTIGKKKDKKKKIRKILFSTDVNMAAIDIYNLYHSRFQIEFLYRDGKQNTGLKDWQSTDSDKLAFGYNASLTAVNVARELSANIEKETGRKLSVASIKRMLHNASLFQQIKEFFACHKSQEPKNNSWMDDHIPPNILLYGVRDAS